MMGLRLFRSRVAVVPVATAPVARERLQIMLAHERGLRGQPELLELLRPGEELTITDQGLPVAQVKKTERTSWPCQAGTAKDRAFWMAPDFNAPLDDFKEYME